MILLSRLLPDSSWLDAICADIERDPRLAGIAVDRLEEWEVPLSDMLLLFAGNQEDISNKPPPYQPLIPAWTTGLPKAVLAAWLERTEPNRIVPDWEVKDSNRPNGEVYRYELVEGCSYRSLKDHNYPVRFNPGIDWESYGCSDPSVYHATEAAAIRDMKRRVLGLFPEVTWRLDNWDEKKWLHTSWTVTAPDLIPPEPVTVRNGEQYQITPTLVYS